MARTRPHPRSDPYGRPTRRRDPTRQHHGRDTRSARNESRASEQRPRARGEQEPTNTRTQQKPRVQEPKLTRGGHKHRLHATDERAWTKDKDNEGEMDRPYKEMRRNRPARVDGRTTKERRIRPYKKMRRSEPARACPRQRRDNEEEQQRRNGSERITPYMEMRRTTCMHQHAQMRRREGSDRYGPGSAI